MRTILLFLALTGLATAVPGPTGSKAKDPIYRGEYFYNFEYSYLRPEGKDEEWCISSDMSKAMLPASRREEQWGTSYVVVRGKLGPKGRFGNLGVCERVLEVTEIVEVKNMRGRD